MSRLRHPRIILFRTIRRPALCFALFLTMTLLSGCGLFHMEQDAAQNAPPPLLQGTPIPYGASIVVAGGEVAATNRPASDEQTPDASNSGTPPTDAENAPTPTKNSASQGSAIQAAMKQNSQLLQLAKEPPDSLLGLERRARVDQETAVRLLHSLGYYDGRASFVVNDTVKPAAVTLTLIPGPRYTVESVRVVYEPKPVVPASFRNRTRETGLIFRRREPLPDPVFPDSLRGVTPGDPAEADPILNAVERLPNRLQREGYPFAKVAKTRYTLNRATLTLLVEVTVDPGPPAIMDGIRVTGAEKVHPAYLERLIPWEEGQPWNSRLVEQYGDTLRQLGLFHSVRVNPLEPTVPPSHTSGDSRSPAAGDLGASDPVSVPVNVDVAEAAFRSVGASARYATDVGFGVQGTWEHRNLFGNGELLRTKASLAQDRQGVSADFEKPAFGRTDQTLLAGSAVEREKTDAYTKTAANAYVGLDRRLTPHWWAEARFFAENGALNENSGKNQYRFLSVSLTLKRDTRNNLLNPTRGSRLTLSLAPYAGFYNGGFTTVAAKLDASAYYAPFGNSRLVLAGRVALGSMTGAASSHIPASLRYYAGGGGSVRGYAYQALGPRDAKGDPIGGRSFQEINLEARFKITDSIGIVPFVDGGMVSESEYPQLGQKLDWAVGLGLRYFTPVGPVRLDVAFPLTHIGRDKRFQLYISIGQAF